VYGGLSPLDQLLERSTGSSAVGALLLGQASTRGSEDDALPGDVPRISSGIQISAALAAAAAAAGAAAGADAAAALPPGLQAGATAANTKDLQSSILGLGDGATVPTDGMQPAFPPRGYGLAGPLGSLGGIHHQHQGSSWADLGDLDLSLLVASQLPVEAAPVPPAAPQLPAQLLFDSTGSLAPAVDMADTAGSLYMLQAGGLMGGVAPGTFSNSSHLMPNPGLIAPPTAASAARQQQFLERTALSMQLQAHSQHVFPHHFDPTALRFPAGSIRTNRLHGGGGSNGGGSTGTPGSRGSKSNVDSPATTGGGGSDSGSSTPVKKTRRGCRGGRQKRFYMAQQMAAAAAINGAAVSSYDMFRVLSGAANPAAAGLPRFPPHGPI